MGKKQNDNKSESQLKETSKKQHHKNKIKRNIGTRLFFWAYMFKKYVLRIDLK